MPSSFLKPIVESSAHLVVISRTGGGGTTTLLGLIEETKKKHKNQSQFFVVSPINQKWLGLERIRNEYKVDNILTTSPAVVYPFGINVQSAIEQINVVHQILAHRAKYKEKGKYSYVSLIIDEWETLHGAMKQCEREAYQLAMINLTKIVVDGSKYNIRLVLKNTSFFSSDFSAFVTKIRPFFSVLVQESSDEQYQFIEKAIEDSYIVEPTQVSKLNQQLNQFRQNATELRQFVALSNVSQPKIGVLPDLSDLKDKVLFGDG
jgi:hypothetical protein